MKKITENMVHFTINAEFDDTPIRGNVMVSGDDAADKAAENKVISQLDDGNVWAWSTVTVTGRYQGLAASDVLGCCSYANEKEFKEGGYYDDMKTIILDELNARAQDLCESLSE